jgi:hypothetical protein
MLPDHLIAIASVAINLAIAVPCMAQDPQMAGYITGDRLITACDSRSERDSALCLGYILGVADAMQASKASGGARTYFWMARVPTTRDYVSRAAVRCGAFPDRSSGRAAIVGQRPRREGTVGSLSVPSGQMKAVSQPPSARCASRCLW